MSSFTRRTLLAAAGTLPALAFARKPAAAAPGVLDLSDRRPSSQGRPVPAFGFTLADGTARTLADYAGQGVVLNLWATWCAPCVAEMPALDELARKVGPERIAVLALSSDRGGAPVVERFYRERDIRSLSVLLDPRGEATRTLGARGLPTTFVIDRGGAERARFEGAADWANPGAIELIRRAVD